MKNKKIRTLLVLGAALAAAVLADLAQAQVGKEKVLFRYRNDRGVLVIDDHVPPNMVRNGYEIMNSAGMVIEKVAPSATEEQIAAQKADLARKQEEARIAEWEKSLSRRYRSVQEIEAARDRQLREFANQVAILKGNLASQRDQIEVQQQRAADLERHGKPVPQNMQDTLANLQRDAAGTEEALAARETEVENVRQEFDTDIEQFKKIQERKALKRAGGVAPAATAAPAAPAADAKPAR